MVDALSGDGALQRRLRWGEAHRCDRPERTDNGPARWVRLASGPRFALGRRSARGRLLAEEVVRITEIDRFPVEPRLGKSNVDAAVATELTRQGGRRLQMAS